MGGVQIRPLVTDAGVMDTEALLAPVRPDDVHQPRTAAVTVEDTHNRHGGVVWPLNQPPAVSSTAHERGLKVHLDGARATRLPISSQALKLGLSPPARYRAGTPSAT
jgi:threonine aldolase